VGRDWRAIATVCAIGPIVRASGASGSENYYALNVDDDGGGFDIVAVLRYLSGSYTNITGTLPLASRVPVGGVLELRVSGTGSTVTLTALINGTVLGTGTDTSGSRIISAGAVGLRITGSGSGTDIIRTLWAGTAGGPSASVSPGSATVAYGNS